ncbi:MAG TPA: hypothetical protein VLA16_17930 [Ideonella sp.]|nr:hypothetical protein [Ideonella sp.]
MADDTNKWDWMQRVLGVSGETPRAPAAGPRPMLSPIWMEAKEEVDAGISRLQDALRQTADDDLLQIAEYGLYGATQGESVKLMAALRVADGGSDEGLAKVLDAVSDYRDFLDGAPIVELIEDNPFGVKVPLRRTLGAALDELERLASA